MISRRREACSRQFCGGLAQAQIGLPQFLGNRGHPRRKGARGIRNGFSARAPLLLPMLSWCGR